MERAAALLVVAVAVTTLVGGALDSGLLTRWGHSLPTTVPATGLCLLFIGLAILSRETTPVATAFAGLALGLAALCVIARLTQWELPMADWWSGPDTVDPGRAGLPTASTMVGLLAAAGAAMLLVVGQGRGAQALAVVPASIGWLSVLAATYGDRLETIAASSLPNTATSLPAGIAFLAIAGSVFAATPDIGISRWLGSDTPGHRAVRRLLPPVIGAPLALTAIALWADLDRRLGEARTWALVMSLFAAGLCVIAVFAARMINDLAGAARRAEVSELRLDSAMRAARVAHLARSLAGAATVEQVASIVGESAPLVLGAEVASVGLVDHEANLLRVFHGPGVSPELRDRFATPSLDEDLAFTDAARTGAMVLVADFDEYRRRYPELTAATSDIATGGRAAIPLMDREGRTFGAIALAWNDPVDFDDTLTSTLSTISGIVAQSLERAFLTDEVARDAERNARLAELAEALAGAATTDDVLALLASAVKEPVGAAVAVVGLIDHEHGVLHRHVDTSVDHGVARLLDSEPLDRPLPLLAAARTGETVLLANRSEVQSRFPLVVPIYDAVGFEASANLPLRDRMGRTFGALGFVWHHPVLFDVRLRDLVSTIAEMTSQTLERAWLGDENARDSERAQALAALAEALTVAHDRAEVAAVVAESLGEVVQADSAELDVHARTSTDEPVIGHDAEGMSALVPLLSSQNRPLGAIRLAWSRPPTTDDRMFTTLATIGELVGQTVERVELTEAEHRMIDALQRRVVRPLPAVEGLTCAAHYEPAAARIGMGGDWYDGIALGEGRRLGLIVGDVVGHGAEPAVEMSQLSGVLATLLRVGVPLDNLFGLVHDAIGAASIYATALACVIDPAAGTIRYASAGHPPPVIIHPDGHIRLLDKGRHPVIGVAPLRTTVAVEEFPPGSTLVAYTDGLVERRNEDIDAGIDRLVDCCRHVAGLDPGPMVGRLIQDLTGEVLVEDDLAVVVVRSTPP